MLEELVKKNRSYRRFYESEKISKEILKSLVNLARLTPSAKNMQSLRYVISTEVEKNEKIFPCLAWAGYLKDWNGPEEGERPSAYILILNDNTLSSNFFCDDGIVIQTILLGAIEKGLGGCIIGSLNKKQLRKALSVPESYDILYAIALGKPKEEVLIEEIGKAGDVKYWRDKNNVHHVPKRGLDELILEI